MKKIIAQKFRIINWKKRETYTGRVQKKLLCIMMLLVVLVVLSACGMDAAENEIVMKLSVNENQTVETLFTDEGDLNAAVSEQQDSTAVLSDAQMVYIYICGAVHHPGVYHLRAESRLFEAVDMAGGLTEEADSTCLNMARQISDGEQVLILTREETAKLEQEGKYIPGQNMPVPSEKNALAVSELVNINTASVSELIAVSGIGESRAMAIIAYREANGAFRCIEDIKKVDGIKEGLFSKIKDKITV